ncbi:WhiB family transcriptional regulator [Streptomyces mirabilis]|uniref:WhiB family transcriptional regulator n=1 Tax=Streptomyces mirabilis TaxID=68239 RepID=UPI003691F4D3
MNQHTDWRDTAACKADPDAMHPDNNEVGIANAKQICATCPGTLPCLVDAILTGDNEHGIRAGLRPKQRRAIVHTLAAGQRADRTAVTAAARKALGHPTDDLREIWEDRSHTMPGGHLGWHGGETVIFSGHVYTPNRLSFEADRGRPPVGMVRRTCEVDACVHPRHLADSQERQQAVEEAGAK